MNSLMGWFEQHVHAVLTEENTDLPPLTPAAVLWGLGPSLPGRLASSAWTTWLSRHSGLSRVAGWQPDESDTGDASALPELILPQLPAGRGLTPRGRAARGARDFHPRGCRRAAQQWLEQSTTAAARERRYCPL